MIIEGLSGAQPTGTGQAAGDASKLGGDLNRFLTLLVTQLQNQDPLDPLDANQFTSQLVEFASVEQQIYQNSNLETLIGVGKNAEVASMVNFIGKSIEAAGTTLPLEDGAALASYTLAEPTAATTITIRDADDRVVAVKTGETAGGRHTLEWDGRDVDDQQLPDGAYSLEISAVRADGSAIEVGSTITGRVSGASAGGGEATLFIGSVPVPMTSVMTVGDSAPRAAGQS